MSSPRGHGARVEGRWPYARSLGALHEFDEAPALVLGQGPGLHESNGVAHAAFVLLVVDLEPRPPPDVAAVRGMLDQALDRNHDRLVHTVADHFAQPDLAAMSSRGRRFGHTFWPSFATWPSFPPNTVRRRAISRRPCRILSGLSSCRMEFRKRRL